VNDEFVHAFSRLAPGLTAPALRTVPQAWRLEAERRQPCPDAGYDEVPSKSACHQAQVLAPLGDSALHAPWQPIFDRVQFGAHCRTP